ncbi:3,4-dihydroxy-2-butanone-4-phosphate synthase [Anaplasmataceae bacterium AB001_6]|nr:3,4-dihydroxy-2-butanone-4-phosphate synthase [Anaplasmataceae bacterium AB001_6]
MEIKIANLQDAINDLIGSNPVIIIDDPDRENEGDLICPVEILTPAIINFMIKNCGGMICITITEEQRKKFNLPIIEKRNVNRNMANFTVPIEAAHGISTGISANDRYKSIKTLTDANSTISDIAIPGHVMPIVIESAGLQKRKGHTEASASLSKLAGFTVNNVICEVLNENGDSAKGDILQQFAQKHNLRIIDINSIKQNMIEQNIDFKLD